MTKLLIALAATLISLSAQAAPATSEEVLKVARMSISMYGFYRIGDLGGAGGNTLSEKQICGLAGQAFTGFGILNAAGLTEQEMAQQLGGLAEFGINLTMVQDQLSLDMDSCD